MDSERPDPLERLDATTAAIAATVNAAAGNSPATRQRSPTPPRPVTADVAHDIRNGKAVPVT
ncbi:hypothetical protein ACRAKI_20580 [Saccharothrix isguenensis]